MSNKSKWKTTSAQDCGCQNQQKNAFSTEKGVPAHIRVRIKPCLAHFICSESNPTEHYDDNYYDNFVDGRGF